MLSFCCWAGRDAQRSTAQAVSDGAEEDEIHYQGRDVACFDESKGDKQLTEEERRGRHPNDEHERDQPQPSTGRMQAQQSSTGVIVLLANQKIRSQP